MATRKKQKKKSETQQMNDALRAKAGVSADDQELEELYLQGLEDLNEFVDFVIADAEEKAAQAAANDNPEALKNADEGETQVGEMGLAFLEIYTALGVALGIEVEDDEDGAAEDEEA
jgi:hypothetical protein